MKGIGIVALLQLSGYVLAYNPSMSWDVCSPSRIKVTVSGAADGGIIYIKGYGSACKQDTSSVDTQHEFIFESCGIDAETYFTIIVQKNPLYQTGDDLQESLLCIFDLSDISVSNSLNVGDKEDDDGINKTVKPTAQMKLYKGGQDISGSDVKLSDLVTITIQLDEEFIGDFDIKARHCTANYIEIILDYCSADRDLFPNFATATQGAITSSFGAFRTTNLDGGFVNMIFACTVQVCLGLCTPSECDEEGGWGRRKRDTDAQAYDDINVGASFTVRTDVDVTPTEPDTDNGLCIDNSVFIIGVIIITTVLLTSTSMTIYVTNKLMKRSEELRKLGGSDVSNDTAVNDGKCSAVTALQTTTKVKEDVSPNNPGARKTTVEMKTNIHNSAAVANDTQAFASKPSDSMQRSVFIEQTQQSKGTINTIFDNATIGIKNGKTFTSPLSALLAESTGHVKRYSDYDYTMKNLLKTDGTDSIPGLKIRYEHFLE